MNFICKTCSKGEKSGGIFDHINWFFKREEIDGNFVYFCKSCQQMINVAGRKNQNLRRHLIAKHSNLYKDYLLHYQSKRGMKT